MEIYKEIIKWPNCIEILIDINNFKIIHKTYGLFIIKFRSNDNIFTLESNGDINSNHLFRICKIKKQYIIDELFELFFDISNIIKEPFKYCTICANFNFKLLTEPSYCSMDCQKNIYNIWTNNIVSESVQNEITFKFLLETSISAYQSPKKDLIFKPFPPMFKDFNDMDQHIDISINELYNIIKNCQNDNEIINKININYYAFIKYLILSNNFNLKLEVIHQIKKDKLEYGKDIICFEILHNIIKKNKFDTNKPQFLYHGSNIYNWYSIMRNGLKNCSGTSLMANGAAYGNGIYFSDSAQMSNSYSRNIGTSEIRVIGIAQILDKEKYHKGGNVFVIPDEDNVLLKYLIVVPSSGSKYLNEFCNFIHNRESEIINSNGNMLNIVIKRLTKEYNSIKDKYEINIEQKNNNIIWNVIFKKQNFNIYLSIIFGSSFPHDPPFIMINKPTINCKNNDGIYNNGIIFVKNITPKFWNPKNKILDILNEIKDIIDNNQITINNNNNYDYDQVLMNYDDILKINNLY